MENTKQSKTNFDAIKEMDKESLSTFIVLQIKMFLKTQGLSFEDDQNATSEMIETYKNWLDKESSFSTIEKDN